MRFLLHAVKQPPLRTESKRERREKEEDIKFKLWLNKKKPVHTGLKIIFIVGQRKVCTGRQLQSRILVIIEFSFGPLT